MLSSKKVREILGNNKATEEQIKKMRDEMYVLAEIFFEEVGSKGGSKKHSWVIDSNHRNDGN